MTLVARKSRYVNEEKIQKNIVTYSMPKKIMLETC